MDVKTESVYACIPVGVYVHTQDVNYIMHLRIYRNCCNIMYNEYIGAHNSKLLLKDEDLNAE